MQNDQRRHEHRAEEDDRFPRDKTRTPSKFRVACASSEATEKPIGVERRHLPAAREAIREVAFFDVRVFERSFVALRLQIDHVVHDVAFGFRVRTTLHDVWHS